MEPFTQNVLELHIPVFAKEETQQLLHKKEAAAAATDELSVLVRRCIEKSPQAQKQLYDRFAPMAYGMIKRYLFKDDGCADEILNDAFLKVFAKLQQYAFQGSFEGWIRKIVVNTLTDHLRKRMKTANEISLDIVPEKPDTGANGPDKMSFNELLKLVQSLPDTQRTVFNLFVFENYSHKEISELLDIKENNCRWYLNDARNRLKEMLKALQD